MMIESDMLTKEPKEDECYRREKMHLEEMQNWISCEKDPQRFLVDGLRQVRLRPPCRDWLGLTKCGDRCI